MIINTLGGHEVSACGSLDSVAREYGDSEMAAAQIKGMADLVMVDCGRSRFLGTEGAE